MLVPVKFTHLPGYTAFTNLRVARRTVNLAVGTNLLYDVTLTLSTRGVSSAGGGSGGFPQQATDPDPDETIDVCNSVIEDSNRDGTEFGTVLAVAGEAWYFEIEQTSHTAGAKVTGIHLDSAGVVGSTVYNFLPLWTSGQIGVGAGTPALPLKTGTFTVGTQSRGPAASRSAPWSPWTSRSTPGSTTSTGTTAFPYATGSLLVKVDGVLISTASYTETDPTTGAFTLSWVIDSDEIVTVQYLGR
jgi:hypothetical protein